MWDCTQLGNAFGLIMHAVIYSLLCMCVCVHVYSSAVCIYMYAWYNVALCLCAVLMEHAATLGGLVASAGDLRGNTEDPASMQ